MKEQDGGTYSPERLGRLSLAQIKELREQSAKGRRRVHMPPLIPQERGNTVSLSYAQERLWFLDQLGLVGPAYNATMALRLEGKLNLGALERSFGELIRRHESLRTHFESIAGSPVQVVTPRGSFALEVRDISGAERDQALQVQRLTSQEAQRPFDLARGPLLRASLLKLSQHEHVLLLATHHIVSDGWSLGVLNRELGALYSAYARDQPSPLSELPVQYADYAIWQRQWLQGEVLENQLQYWSEQLTGAPPQLQLPTDRPRPAVASFKGALLSFDLPAVLRLALEKLARDGGATLFMVVLAAFQVLLSRYSGEHDVVVGSVVAGRTHAQTEGLIGLFVNTLILRTELSGNLSFRQLLGRVKEVTLGAYAHQGLPFEKLVIELRPERNLTRQPIFQVALALQNFPHEQLELVGLTWTPIDIEQITALFDLSLYLFESSDGLGGLFEYATDLFNRETIERMAGHFRTLLEGIVAEPDRPIRQLQLLRDTDREQVLHRFNDTAVPYTREKVIHELFEDQQKRTPDAMAVMYKDQSLTYAVLNARANQLARYLRGKGVGPDQLVALCVERSLEMVVGLLGILKAGGAYVPLDPAYPFERLAYMLKDAAPTVLLTQERLKGKLPDTAAEVISLDSDWNEIAGEIANNLDLRAVGLRSQHLAYVIYTSGSTGTPKGVLVAHENLVASNFARTHFYGMCRHFLLISSIAFDSSCAGIFGVLTTGGKLTIATEDSLCDPGALLDAIRQQGITDLLCVPSLYHSMLSLNRDGNSIASLARVVVAGEVCPASLLEMSAQGTTNIRLFNEYGPTEATVWATVFECKDDAFDSNVPIGRPIANTQIYILDQCYRVVPIGVVGEIYIGGAGVARGYLNRPELTAERFLPDLFRADSRARLYKTGDLGRWRSDGTIEYQGRNDDQVKIRGYRIELGEVEAQLRRYGQVREAAIVAREDVPGEKRLVAYVIPDDATDAGAAPSVEALRAHLKAVLPGYMVPSAFVMLKCFPLTPNGKLDRSALPAPELGAYGSRQYEAPQGEMEEILAQIWKELLRVERVGRHDNFFELGGHSLLATRLISRVRELLRVELPLRALFDAQTMKQLSVCVKAQGDKQAAHEALRTGDLARDLRQEIYQMHDDAVLARIAELEKELGYAEGDRSVGGCAEQ
jgi:amino acid adenylation domain-containing protein